MDEKLEARLAALEKRESSDKSASSKHRKKLFSLLIGIAAILAMIAIGGIFFYRLHSNANTISNPFSNETINAVEFPLYYPMKLPAKFKLDSKSVRSPEKGVIVITINGPNNAKLYISQQARPAKFDIGGYYKNFSSSSQITTDNGVIATGYIDDGKTVIGSIATQRSWVITNSIFTDSLKPSDLQAVLNSLVVAHPSN